MLVIAAQESELKPLREAYEATQTALQLERQIAAEAVERTANLDEECAALRQQLTHLSTVRHWPGMCYVIRVVRHSPPAIFHPQSVTPLHAVRHDVQMQEISQVNLVGELENAHTVRAL